MFKAPFYSLINSFTINLSQIGLFSNPNPESNSSFFGKKIVVKRNNFEFFKLINYLKIRNFLLTIQFFNVSQAKIITYKLDKEIV